MRNKAYGSHGGGTLSKLWSGVGIKDGPLIYDCLSVCRKPMINEMAWNLLL